jgi:hypothetical protein
MSARRLNPMDESAIVQCVLASFMVIGVMVYLIGISW